MSDILGEVRELCTILGRGKHPMPTDPSLLWSDRIRDCIAGRSNARSLSALVHSAQEANVFSPFRPVNQPESPGVIRGYLDWLAGRGHPLASYPAIIQESHLASPQTCMFAGDRSISAQFLHDLCVCERVFAQVAAPLRGVIEIGGGFGGLARLFKLFEPSAQYWIVDLPEVLAFAYGFLRGNFPEARCVAVPPDGPATGDLATADFVLVPAGAIERLQGMAFDLVLNVGTLGEMTQTAVDRYFQLIEQEIHPAFFYSLDRYGQFPVTRVIDGLKLRYEMTQTPRGHWIPGEVTIEHSERFNYIARSAGPTSCDYATPFDPYWSVLLWQAYGEGSFAQIDPAYPPTLECLVKRVPKPSLPDAQRERAALDLLREATQRADTDRAWERLMWDSVRTFPCRQNLVPWLDFLERANYDEYLYFKRSLDGLGA